MLLEPKRMPVAADLTAASLEQAAELMGAVVPWTYLLCTSGNIGRAQKAIEGWNGIEIAVVQIEVLDPDQWLLVGPNGVVWSGIV